MAAIVASFLAISSLFIHVRALPPQGFTTSYIGNVNRGGNLMSMAFLPNGYTVLADRTGYIAIANLNTGQSGNIPQQPYMDLSPVTRSDQFGFAEIGLFDVKLDPYFASNREYLRFFLGK